MESQWEQAERLLDEVVYASRARQGLAGALASASHGNADGGAAGGCGLGAKAHFERQFGARARELADALWSEGVPAAAERVLGDWVRRQDGFDRERNHFLKAFRGEHGPNRQDYAPAVAARFEAGLAEINGRQLAARRESALALVATGRSG